MRTSSLLDSLMPRVRQDVLQAVLLHPNRWWYQRDLAHHLQLTPSSLQRELASLTASGILQSRRDGNRIYYHADPACPILPELQGLLVKTVGVVDVLREALAPCLSQIACAFVYGSIARGEATSDSDIDVMIVGEIIRIADIALRLRKVQPRLQRAINPTFITPQELADKAAQSNHFITTVLQQPKIILVGSGDELDTIAGRTPGQNASDKP